ncbi:YaiO family outer membrane beta-barrel protein [Maricaulis salignorans]|uniref:YaiO family outer membrane beta-barrel protein n=1 Tax=Maricaulis salignorans TaxID=144026 RepID=UPI003A8E6E11
MLVETVTAILLALQAVPAETGDWRADVWRLSDQGDYSAALARVGTSPEPSGYEARVMRVRVLAWSHDYQSAERELAELERAFPGNPELEAVRGSLAYYQGRNDDAETAFRAALALDPDLAEARDGLARLDAGTTGTEMRLRLDMGMGVSSFSRSANSNWTQAFSQLTWIAPRFSAGIRTDTYDRFGLRNDSLGLRFTYRIDEDWDVEGSADLGPGNVFRPEQSLGITIGRRWVPPSTDLPAVRTTLGLRRDQYNAVTVDSASLGIGMFWEGYSLETQVISIADAGEDASYGALLRGSYELGERATFSLGLADAPETDAGVTVNTRSLFAGVRYRFDENRQIRLDCARDDRENSYIRKACSVSISYQF